MVHWHFTPPRPYDEDPGNVGRSPHIIKPTGAEETRPHPTTILNQPRPGPGACADSAVYTRLQSTLPLEHLADTRTRTKRAD